MYFYFFLGRVHAFWQKQYKAHCIVLVDLKCHVIESIALQLWKCNSHSEYCLVTSTQHALPLKWCSSISLRQKLEIHKYFWTNCISIFSFFSTFFVCSQLYCKILESVTENFLNSFLNNNSRSFTDFQFVLLLLCGVLKSWFTCCDFFPANTFKILQHMKNSTLATGFAFGVTFASNKYTECWEKEY